MHKISHQWIIDTLAYKYHAYGPVEGNSLFIEEIIFDLINIGLINEEKIKFDQQKPLFHYPLTSKSSQD